MKLKKWANTPQRRKLLMQHTGLSESAVCRIINGVTPVNPRHFAAIERATEGQVTRAEMRTDIFGKCPSKLKSDARAPL